MLLLTLHGAACCKKEVCRHHLKIPAGLRNLHHRRSCFENKERIKYLWKHAHIMKVQIRHACPPQRAQPFKLLSLDWTSEDMSDFVAPRGMLMEFLSGVPVGNLTHVIADHESEVSSDFVRHIHGLG